MSSLLFTSLLVFMLLCGGSPSSSSSSAASSSPSSPSFVSLSPLTPFPSPQSDFLGSKLIQEDGEEGPGVEDEGELYAYEEPSFVVWVSSSQGNDSNDGSEFSPVATLSGAFSLIHSAFPLPSSPPLLFASPSSSPSPSLPLVLILLYPGLYSGSLNRNLSLPSHLSFNISGLGSVPEDTVLEGEGTPFTFFSFSPSSPFPSPSSSSSASPFSSPSSSSSLSSSSATTSSIFASSHSTSKKEKRGGGEEVEEEEEQEEQEERRPINRIIIRLLTFQNSSSTALFFAGGSLSIFLHRTRFLKNTASVSPMKLSYGFVPTGALTVYYAKQIVVSSSVFVQNGHSSWPSSRTIGGIAAIAYRVIIHNCTLENNQSGKGFGALFMASYSRLKMTKTLLRNNTGSNLMWIEGLGEGDPDVTFSHCQFRGNPTRSTRIYLNVLAVVFHNCHFSDEGVTTSNAFLYFKGGRPLNSTIQSCLFTNISGNGLRLEADHSVHLVDSRYINNKVGLNKFVSLQPHLIVERCRFSGNQVSRGPLIHFAGITGFLHLSDSIFDNNHANKSTISLVRLAKGRLTGNTFLGNTGSVVSVFGETTVHNCSFSFNTGRPSSQAAVLLANTPTSLTISSSRFYGNTIFPLAGKASTGVLINDSDFEVGSVSNIHNLGSFQSPLTTVINCRFVGLVGRRTLLTTLAFEGNLVNITNSLFVNVHKIVVGNFLRSFYSQNNTFWNSGLMTTETDDQVVLVSNCIFVFDGSAPLSGRIVNLSSQNRPSITFNDNLHVCINLTHPCDHPFVVTANQSATTNQLNQTYINGPLVIKPMAITNSRTFGSKLAYSPSFLCLHDETIISINITISSNHPFVINITNDNLQQSLLINTTGNFFFAWNETSFYTLKLNQSIYFVLQPTEEYFTSEIIDYLNPSNVSQFDTTVIEVIYKTSVGYYLPHSKWTYSKVSLSSGYINLAIELYDEWGNPSFLSSLKSYPILVSPDLFQGSLSITNQTTRTFWNAPATSGRLLVPVSLYLDGQPLTPKVLSLWWVLGIVLTFVTGAALYVFVSRIRQYRARLLQKQQEVEEKQKELQLMEEVWRIQPDEIKWREKIASGGFGEVWKCEWRETPVAVKQLMRHWIEMDKESSEIGFEKEVKLLRSIRHPNIVLFYGAGIQSDGLPFLVTEYVTKGSLFTVILQEPFSWKQKAMFLLDAAEGMKFLHSLDPPMIHRDLKPHNMLVTNQLRVKIADFGTAKLLNTTATVTTTPLLRLSGEEDPEATSGSSSSPLFSVGRTTNLGTPNYRAPELFNSDLLLGSRTPSYYSYSSSSSSQSLSRSNYTGKEADVYSFGITMWAVATEKEPFEQIPLDELSDRIGRGERPPLTTEEGRGRGRGRGSDWPEEWVELMKACWTDRVDIRPRFATVVVLLKSLLLELSEQETVG